MPLVRVFSAFTPLQNPVWGLVRRPTISMPKVCAVPSELSPLILQLETKGEKVDETAEESGAVRIDGYAGSDEDTLLRDWQLFCKEQPLPVLVKLNMQKIKEIEVELGEELHFGGPRGSLKGRPGAEEDHRHRAVYVTLSDSEEKLQNFTARQVACRVLGSKGYLCNICWLPQRDCMCETYEKGSLWPGVCLWVYMHPKDFLRKNNTGKLLWQVFGDKAAKLAVCGIPDQEDIMWNVFKEAGRDCVWCVYPENPQEYEVKDISIPGKVISVLNENEDAGGNQLHFVLIDGTWSNSKAMVSRLKDRASALWNGSSMRCVALSPKSVSVMHGLRPQPSTERTCTAAAAGQLLRELSMKSELVGLGLDHSAELLDDGLLSLQDALVSRRRRVGRTTARFGRVKCNALIS